MLRLPLLGLLRRDAIAVTCTRSDGFKLRLQEQQQAVLATDTLCSAIYPCRFCQGTVPEWFDSPRSRLTTAHSDSSLERYGYAADSETILCSLNSLTNGAMIFGLCLYAEASKALLLKFCVLSGNSLSNCLTFATDLGFCGVVPLGIANNYCPAAGPRQPASAHRPRCESLPDPAPGQPPGAFHRVRLGGEAAANSNRAMTDRQPSVTQARLILDPPSAHGRCVWR